MKKIILSLALLSFVAHSSAESEHAKDIDRLDHAAKVLAETMRAPDQRIPGHILKGARCIAVVPHLVKGGFVFGAGRRDLPDGEGLECSGLHPDRRR